MPPPSCSPLGVAEQPWLCLGQQEQDVLDVGNDRVLITLCLLTCPIHHLPSQPCMSHAD